MHSTMLSVRGETRRLILFSEVLIFNRCEVMGWLTDFGVAVRITNQLVLE